MFTSTIPHFMEQYIMSSNLCIIFKAIATKAMFWRKLHGHSFDGREFWQRIKKLLSLLEAHVPANCMDWIPHPPGEAAFSRIRNDFTLNDNVLVEHFLIQLARIRYSQELTFNPCCLVKVMQLALNAGQLLGSASPEFLQQWSVADLDLMSLETYVELNNSSSLEMIATPRDFMSDLEKVFEDCPLL